MDEQQQSSDNSFVTVKGERVGVRPVSEILVERAMIQLEQKWREKGERIDPPTYMVELAGGATQALEHDETTKKTPEEQAAWDAYKDARARLTAAQTEKKMDFWLLAGLVFDMPKTDDWAQQQELLFGVTVPAEPTARRKWYIETELLSSAADLITAIERVSEASLRGLVSRDVISTQIKSLQSATQGAAAAVAGGTGGQATGSEAQPVAVRPSAGTGSPGEVLGHDAKAPRKARRPRS